MLDEKTGEFNREGNIYTDTYIYTDETILKVVKDNPPTLAAREDMFIVASAKVKRYDLNLGPEM